MISALVRLGGGRGSSSELLDANVSGYWNRGGPRYNGARGEICTFAHTA